MPEILYNKTVEAAKSQRRSIPDRRGRTDRRARLEVAVDRTIDARGAYCPGPLMKLIAAIKTAPVGSVIEILSSVLGSSKEIPYWAAKYGHEHLGTEERNGYWSILVRKGR